MGLALTRLDQPGMSNKIPIVFGYSRLGING